MSRDVVFDMLTVGIMVLEGSETSSGIQGPYAKGW